MKGREAARAKKWKGKKRGKEREVRDGNIKGRKITKEGRGEGRESYGYKQRGEEEGIGKGKGREEGLERRKIRKGNKRERKENEGRRGERGKTVVQAK